MAVIWGLDLKEMQWGKFKNSYMWNNEYHLRRTKFIVYQLAMIFCVVSESLGTAALSGAFLLSSTTKPSILACCPKLKITKSSQQTLILAPHRLPVPARLRAKAPPWRHHS